MPPLASTRQPLPSLMGGVLEVSSVPLGRAGVGLLSIIMAKVLIAAEKPFSAIAVKGLRIIKVLCMLPFAILSFVFHACNDDERLVDQNNKEPAVQALDSLTTLDCFEIYITDVTDKITFGIITSIPENYDAFAPGIAIEIPSSAINIKMNKGDIIDIKILKYEYQLRAYAPLFPVDNRVVYAKEIEFCNQ